MTPAPIPALEPPPRCPGDVRRWTGWLSTAVYAGLFVGGVVLLMPLTALPMTWDELWYMGLAFQPEPEPRLLNRYGHIYLLALFMKAARDPFLAGRLYWCAAAMTTLLSLAAATAPLRLPLRGFVLTMALYLIVSQDTFAWYMGIPHVDFTVMWITALSVAIAMPSILRREPLSVGRSFALGALFLLGMKCKEAAIVLASLAVIPWMGPASGLLPTRRGLRNLGAYVLGMVATFVALAALDGLLLGDALFSVRPSNWRSLLQFNMISGYSSPYDYFSWMCRPINFTAFLLYLGVLLPLAVLESNPRFVPILLLPLANLLFLISTYWTGNAVVVVRYTVVFLPIMCLLGSLGAGRLLERLSKARCWSQATLWCAWAIAGAALWAAFMSDRLSGLMLYEGDGPRLLKEVIFAGAPYLILSLLALGLGLVPRWRVPISLLAFSCLVFTALPPALRVVNANRNTHLPTELGGASRNRFRDLRELAGSIPVTERTRFLLAPDIYSGELHQRGPFFARTLLAMASRRPLRRDQVVIADSPDGLDPREALSFDYLMVMPATAEPLLARLEAAGLRGPIHVRKTGPDPQVVLLINPAPASPPTTASRPATQP